MQRGFTIQNDPVKTQRCRLCLRIAAWSCEKPTCPVPPSPVAKKMAGLDEPLESKPIWGKGAGDYETRIPRDVSAKSLVHKFIEREQEWFQEPRTILQILGRLKEEPQPQLKKIQYSTLCSYLRMAAEKGLICKVGRGVGAKQLYGVEAG